MHWNLLLVKVLQGLAWTAEHVLAGMQRHPLELTSKDLVEDAYSGFIAAKSLMAASKLAPELWRALPGMLSKPAVEHKRLRARVRADEYRNGSPYCCASLQ